MCHSSFPLKSRRNSVRSGLLFAPEAQNFSNHFIKYDDKVFYIYYVLVVAEFQVWKDVYKFLTTISKCVQWHLIFKNCLFWLFSWTWAEFKSLFQPENLSEAS